MKINPPVMIYRISHFFWQRKLYRTSKFISYMNRLIFGVWIPGSAQIGKNFKLGYWGLGVVIHNNAVIGDNCTVAQNVTIGRTFGDTNVPIIGDDVYIGTGSVIFGNIIIGNNVIIGANTLVNKSLDKDTTAVGNPFKIIQQERKEKYYELDGKK